jgi:hypothetical protein
MRILPTPRFDLFVAHGPSISLEDHLVSSLR